MSRRKAALQQLWWRALTCYCRKVAASLLPPFLPQLMADIVAEGPDSERIVMTMTYTYKAAGQLGGITKVGAHCWVLGAGCWVLGAGCWLLGASPRALISPCPRLATAIQPTCRLQGSMGTSQSCTQRQHNALACPWFCRRTLLRRRSTPRTQRSWPACSAPTSGGC